MAASSSGRIGAAAGNGGDTGGDTGGNDRSSRCDGFAGAGEVLIPCGSGVWLQVLVRAGRAGEVGSTVVNFTGDAGADAAACGRKKGTGVAYRTCRTGLSPCTVANEDDHSTQSLPGCRGPCSGGGGSGAALLNHWDEGTACGDRCCIWNACGCCESSPECRLHSSLCVERWSIVGTVTIGREAGP
jgi:hypothetical protein